MTEVTEKKICHDNGKCYLEVRTVETILIPDDTEYKIMCGAIGACIILFVVVLCLMSGDKK